MTPDDRHAPTATPTETTPACPHCGGGRFATLPNSRDAWLCETCAEWEDVEVPSDATP